MGTETRVALVTGGTRGIGRAITDRLTRSGVTVAAAYAQDVAAAQAVRDDGARRGATVTLHQADVGQPASCQSLVGEVLEQHGRLDYLVNNAGMVNEQRLSEISHEDWHRQVAVNLSSAFFVSQAALAHMTQQRFGRVVNIGSVTALLGSPVQVAYGAAKGGIVGLTRSCARAVARKGITVNCVIPGSFDTDMSAQLLYTDRDAVTSMIPVGRWGRPEELAHAVVFLLDDLASYMTGAVLTVDGGMSMGG
ncbi:SDR family NAD(P)-dependent oxidoreductase [Mycobacterium parmense]|uniref:3-oxoacyl-[acyl-carrier-protein] reductase MabA n=1 Tax=Mycobacterium parmense TaxID=185642 RepID=A0A7I7Z3U0_9MYCO|nr:3-oxoacyl-ACP reductase family protein [Mycobacterium parmense]MCV7352382.1 3-oxoacyl-ACP reductase FabG [Mycobacterium parmense]ORW56346.1 beta-ketoacyl-ACP reductase [Mycobacterium parmense]BBZ47894.1 beta-ketoacyl-ACP reductase [Mycobacterium parmense]